MDLLASLEAIRDADGAGMADWSAAATAATTATAPGELDLSDAERVAYRAAVREARDNVRDVVGVPVTLPPTIEVVDRHHWIDRAARSFERIMAPTLDTFPQPPIAHTVNTATVAVTLGVLGRRVVGQYDPALFGPASERALYVVHPNLVTVATEMDVDLDTFRRWVIHHEVSHAAEFDLAPWLVEYLEARLERTIDALVHRRVDRAAIRELMLAMTVVEGFAELVMDVAIEADVDELRDKLDARRAGLGPIAQLIDLLLGIEAKRRQYRRGRRFFDHVVDRREFAASLAVWESPETLPTGREIDDPARWLERVDP